MNNGFDKETDSRMHVSSGGDVGSPSLTARSELMAFIMDETIASRRGSGFVKSTLPKSFTPIGPPSSVTTCGIAWTHRERTPV